LPPEAEFEEEAWKMNDVLPPETEFEENAALKFEFKFLLK
jgi:hypothetical protein